MTAEELLFSADVQSTGSTEICMIDPETREITVPAGESLFGVTGDKDVERKFFRCPKVVGDGINLLEHQIYVAYVFTTSSNNTSFPDTGTGLYHCEDVTEDGDDITFSWLLSGNVFSSPGYIAFKVMAKKSEGDELVTKWNTAPSYGTILLTVPDGEDIAEQYPDVINEILNRLDELEEGGVSGGTVSVEVESTSTGEPGTNASVTNSGTDQNVKLNFVIPQGSPGESGAPGTNGTTFTPAVSENGELSWTNDGGKSNPETVNIKGANGQAATIQIGTVTVGPTPSVTNVGTETDAILNFVLPVSNYIFNISQSDAQSGKVANGTFSTLFGYLNSGIKVYLRCQYTATEIIDIELDWISSDYISGSAVDPLADDPDNLWWMVITIYPDDSLEVQESYYKIN